MHIYTVKSGDTIFKIARKFSVSPMKIIENNELENPDSLSVGQKLVIVTPTRTYTVRGSDNVMRICDRFDIKKRDLYLKNPYLCGKDNLYRGQLLTIKEDTAPYGIAAANGYYFPKTSEERLSLCLPYLTYITVALGLREGGEIKFALDDTDVVKRAQEGGKIPLMRIYDKDLDFDEKYADELILLSKTHGYKGITLAPYRAMRENREGLGAFLFRLKEKLKEYGMLLFLEADGNGDLNIPDLCDGYAITYEKCMLPDIPSFAEGEERVMRTIASVAEPSRVYIEIPSYAYMGDEEITKSEAERLASSSRREILYDDEKKICHFDYNKYIGGKRESVRVRYESPENVKSKFDLIGELGLMGICFDIMRIPVEYLVMFESLFYPAEILGEG